MLQISEKWICTCSIVLISFLVSIFVSIFSMFVCELIKKTKRRYLFYSFLFSLSFFFLFRSLFSVLVCVVIIMFDVSGILSSIQFFNLVRKEEIRRRRANKVQCNRSLKVKRMQMKRKRKQHELKWIVYSKRMIFKIVSPFIQIIHWMKMKETSKDRS